MSKKYSLLPYIREDIYGLDTSKQIIGWEISKFNIQKQWIKSQGENIRVAVIDTGCDLDHDDIKDNILQGKNFVEKNKDPYDKNGHGTHVAGTIAASNNNRGMVGVAPKAKIIPVKALGDNGSGNLKNIVDDIEEHFVINEGDVWLDIASNDGTMLSYVKSGTIKVGIDPSEGDIHESCKT